jgi:hypothetical protein
MRKIVIAMLALVSLATAVAPAQADWRYRRAPRVVHGGHGGWVGPAIVGGLALGILGGAIVNERYSGPYCRWVVVDREWDGYRWRPVMEQVCE